MLMEQNKNLFVCVLICLKYILACDKKPCPELEVSPGILLSNVEISKQKSSTFPYLFIYIPFLPPLKRSPKQLTTFF